MPDSDRDRLPKRSGDFAEDGYAVLVHYLDQALLGAVRHEVAKALKAPPVVGCERPHNRLVPLRWNDRTVESVLHSPSRRAAVATVTGGDDLRWISGYVSVKAPRTAALWWHQDWWCWDHPITLRPAAAQVALLCYLDDTDERNGALRLLPGSHRASVPLHAILPDAHAQAGELPADHAALCDQAGQITIRARAGDAVVLDYRLLHATHPNASDQRRDCLLLSFTPSWRSLPPEIRAHLIQHLALPRDDEQQEQNSWLTEALPSFGGTPADLKLNRTAPPRFAVTV